MSVSLIFFPHLFFLYFVGSFTLISFWGCATVCLCVLVLMCMLSVRFGFHYASDILLFCFVQVQIEHVFCFARTSTNDMTKLILLFRLYYVYNYVIVVAAAAAEQTMQKVETIFQIWELETKTTRIDSVQFGFRMYLLEFSRINVPHVTLQIYSLFLFCIQFSFCAWNPSNEKKWNHKIISVFCVTFFNFW